MRYWPLTAVLLAFWLGRETGAEDQNTMELQHLRVGTMEAESIRLTEDRDGGFDGTRIRPAYRATTTIKPGIVTVSWIGLKKGLPAVNQERGSVSLRDGAVTCAERDEVPKGEIEMPFARAPDFSVLSSESLQFRKSSGPNTRAVTEPATAK